MLLLSRCIIISRWTDVTIPYCRATAIHWVHSIPLPSPLPPHPSCPTFASVLGGRADKPQSAPAVQNEEADFTVVDRTK